MIRHARPRSRDPLSNGHRVGGRTPVTTIDITVVEGLDDLFQLRHKILRQRLHVGLGIPYVVSTLFFLAALAAVFIVWYAVEKTLSIHSIHTCRREFFYWITVLATFALGTASGDLTATTLHLGYFTSGVLFAVLIILPGIAYKLFKLNEIFAFWFAYIMTRPLGASFADWISVSHTRGGLGLGTGPVSMTLTVIIIALVSYLAFSHKDVQSEMQS